MLPEISIIVPVYNVEKYLSRCIESILSQSFSDFELILVDDGSTDRSGEICDEFAKKDPRIRVFHKANGGVSDARNAGLDLVTGKYIGFVDGDDYIENCMYRVLWDMIQKDEADISVCGVFNSFENQKRPQCEEMDAFVCNGREAFAITLAGKKMPASLCNKLYRREIFSQRRFLVGKTYEDAFFLPSLLLDAEKVSVTTEPLYNYWHRMDSITSSGYSEKTMDIVDAYEYTYEQVKERCPEALHIAEFRLHRAYFIVLDIMLKEPSYSHLQFYPCVIGYLRKHWLEILHDQYLTKGRRLSVVALKVTVRLYRLLAKMNEKRYRYYE